MKLFLISLFIFCLVSVVCGAGVVVSYVDTPDCATSAGII